MDRGAGGCYRPDTGPTQAGAEAEGQGCNRIEELGIEFPELRVPGTHESGCDPVDADWVWSDMGAE